MHSFENNLIRKLRLKRDVVFNISLISEPHVFPAVYELTDLMESGKAWTLGHVHTAMKEVLSCLNDLVEIFPISLIRLCLDIETRLPRNVRPLCNSVMIHIVVACLYNIISRVQQAARKEKVAREKLDFLIAFGEALNNLDPGVII